MNGQDEGRWGEAGRFLVPLDPDIVRFFLRNLHIPHGVRERAAKLLAATGMTGPLWTGRGPAGWHDLLQIWSAVRADGELLRAASLGSECRSLLQRDDTGEALVVFLFPQADATREARPVAMLKLRSTGGPLAGEAAALRSLAERLPEPLRRTVPSVLAFRTVGEVEALLLEALPGRSAYVEMQAGRRPTFRAESHFEAAASWLAAFHNATRGRERFFTPAEGAPEIPEVPLVFGHGDFWPRNLLLDESGRVTGVVDWEHASLEAPPLLDLCHFSLTYGLNTLWSRGRRRPPEEAFRLTFLDDTVVARAVRGQTRRYAAALGLAPTMLAPLFHLYLWTRFRRACDDEEKELWLRLDRMLQKADRSVFSG